MARREFEAAQAASDDAEERTYEDNMLPIVEAGRAVLVNMDHALDDEVWLEPTPGHTAGHVAIRVSLQGCQPLARVEESRRIATSAL
jgi:glyoxylase-like metal-dependent hydrolase (beta-lactamase superfamily II)